MMSSYIVHFPFQAWSVLMAIVLAGSLVTLGMMFDERYMYHKQDGTLDAFPEIMFEHILSIVNTSKWRAFWIGKRLLLLYVIDILLNIILIGEFFVRFAVCPYKKRFLKSVLTIVDILVFSSYFVGGCLAAAMVVPWMSLPGLQWLWLMCTVLQMLRPVRIIRLANTFVGLRILLMVIRRSTYELFTLVMCLGVGTMLFAFLIFASEVAVEDNFKTVWAGAWWAVVTMTTVGYGDMYPKSTGGYIIGIMCAIAGMVIIALSIPIVTGNFSMYYENVHIEMDKVKQRSREALAVSKSGRITPLDASTVPPTNGNASESKPNLAEPCERGNLSQSLRIKPTETIHS
jgi:hypothetical protein